jgi:cell division GTPase FtsZ
MEGIAKLKEHVDTLLVINNSRVFKVIERRSNIRDAFKRIDEVLKQAVLGISSIISETGVINVDFADVRTVLSNKGEAIMGIGMGHGESRSLEAAKMALENPLIENSSFKNAGAILINIIGSATSPCTSSTKPRAPLSILPRRRRDHYRSVHRRQPQGQGQDHHRRHGLPEGRTAAQVRGDPG